MMNSESEPVCLVVLFIVKKKFSSDDSSLGKTMLFPSYTIIFIFSFKE